MRDELDLLRLLRSDDDPGTALETTRMALMTLLEATTTAHDVLRTARTVLLIDWHEDVPRTLLAAGYDVYHWYDTFTRGELVDAPPESPAEDVMVNPPRPGDDRGYLVWHPVGQPDHVDLFCTFRPPEEHLDYLDRFAIPLGATAFWVEAGGAAHSIALGYEGASHTNPVAADAARERATRAGMAVVEGLSIAEVLRDPALGLEPSASSDEAAPTITPGLTAVDAHGLIRWLVELLEFRIAALHDDGDGGVAHAQLSWRTGNVFVSTRHPGTVWATAGPASICLAAESAAEIDRLYFKAQAAGAEIIAELHDAPYGSHEFGLRDPEGNLWTVGTYRPPVARQ